MRQLYWRLAAMPLALGVSTTLGCVGLVEMQDESPLEVDRGPARHDAHIFSPGEPGRPAPDLSRPEAAKPDLGVDLLTNAGDPCINGYLCTSGLVCYMGYCSKTCETTTCNEPAAGCAPDETCTYFSSFNGACAKATAQVGDNCGEGTLATCAANTLCVNVEDIYTRCLQVCKPCSQQDTCCLSNCAGGAPCCPTTNGCFVCVQQP